MKEQTRSDTHPLPHPLQAHRIRKTRLNAFIDCITLESVTVSSTASWQLENDF